MSCPVPHASNDKGSCPMEPSSLKMNMQNQMEEDSGQNAPESLSSHRVISNIPKGDFTPSHQVPGASTWLYPSEKQYFNAMTRKGWNPKEDDMKSIVAIHNTVNEKGWTEILKWEASHYDNVEDIGLPKLVRFLGRPKEISPKARMLNMLGYTLPFDRHDWTIERPCGKEVRYILDFYTGRVELGDRPLAMYIDARPALDSFGDVFDRVKMTYHQSIKPYLPFGGMGLGMKTSTNSMEDCPIVPGK